MQWTVSSFIVTDIRYFFSYPISVDFIDFVIFEYHKVSFGDDHTHTATPKEELEVIGE